MVEPRERELTETSSVPRDAAVDGREADADSGCANAAELAAISLLWSLPSRIGQLREREPMTSICLSREPVHGEVESGMAMQMVRSD